GKKFSSLSSGAGAPVGSGAEAACVAPSRTGPEFVMNRAPRLERSGQASTAAANIGGRWPAAQRSAIAGPVAGSVPRGRVFGGGCLSEPQGHGEDVALRQRRHSMATNSSRADVPVVVGTAPAISSRSILRNEAAST